MEGGDCDSGATSSARPQSHECSTELEESALLDTPTLLGGLKRKERCFWSCLFPWTASSNHQPLVLDEEPPNEDEFFNGNDFLKLAKEGVVASFQDESSLATDDHDTSSCSTESSLESNHPLQEGGESASDNSQAIVVYQQQQQQRPSSSDRTSLPGGPMAQEAVQTRVAEAYYFSFKRLETIASSSSSSKNHTLDEPEKMFWTITKARLEERQVLWLASNPHEYYSGQSVLMGGQHTHSILPALSPALYLDHSDWRNEPRCLLLEAVSVSSQRPTLPTKNEDAQIVNSEDHIVPIAVQDEKPPRMQKMHRPLTRKTQYIKYKVHPRVVLVVPKPKPVHSKAPPSRTSASLQVALPGSTIISQDVPSKQLVSVRPPPPTLSQYLDSTSYVGDTHGRYGHKDLSPKRKRARSDSSSYVTHSTCSETCTSSSDSSSVSPEDEEVSVSSLINVDCCCSDESGTAQATSSCCSLSTSAASCVGCTACSLKQELLEQKDEEIASLKQALYKLAMESDRASNIMRAHRSEQEANTHSSNKSNRMSTTVRLSQALANSSVPRRDPPAHGGSKETPGTPCRVRHHPIHIAGRSAYYSGPLDDQGRAHGSGCARFANGELYVGLFEQGSLKSRGTLYSKTGQVLCQVR